MYRKVNVERLAPLVGLGPVGKVFISKARDEFLEASSNGDTIILSRTNANVLREAIQLCAHFEGRKKIAVVKANLESTIKHMAALIQLAKASTGRFTYKKESFGSLLDAEE